MPKQYITKSNEERFKNEGKDELFNELYKDFNLKLVLREFIGSMLNGLVCATPKMYISRDQRNDLLINSERLPPDRTISLREYLNLEQTKHPDEYTKEEKEKIAEKLNQLKGIGPLLFMSLLLGDRDAVGISMDNALVVDKNVFKIDAADINLPLGDYATKTDNKDVDHYTGILKKNLPQFAKNGEFLLSHEFGYHYINFFLSLLNDEQKKAGLAAIKSVMAEPKLTENLQWLGKAIKAIGEGKTADEKSITEDIKKTLQARSEIILQSYGPLLDPDNSIKPYRVKDIKQTIFMRTAADFKATHEKKIEIGSSKPSVTEKRDSSLDNLALFNHAKKEIKQILADLMEKTQSFDAKKSAENENELNIVKNATKEYMALYNGLKSIEKEHAKNIRDSDILKIYDGFTKIYQTTHAALWTEESKKSPLQSAKTIFTDNVIGTIKRSSSFRLFTTSSQIEKKLSTLTVLEDAEKRLASPFEVYLKEKGVIGVIPAKQESTQPSIKEPKGDLKSEVRIKH